MQCCFHHCTACISDQCKTGGWGGQLIRDRNLFGRLLPPNHLSLLTKIGNKTRVDVFLPPTENNFKWQPERRTDRYTQGGHWVAIIGHFPEMVDILEFVVDITIKWSIFHQNLSEWR